MLDRNPQKAKKGPQQIEMGYKKKASIVPFQDKQDGLTCSVLNEWDNSYFKAVLDCSLQRNL